MSCLERLPKVNRCCFCISLPLGTRLIAIVELLYWTWAIYDTICELYLVPESTNKLKIHLESKDHVFSGHEAAEFSRLLSVILSITMVLCMAGTVFAIFLTIGVFKIKPNLIRIWLIGAITMILIYLPVQIWLASDTHAELRDEEYNIFADLVFLAIRLFFWFTVNTYHALLIQTVNPATYYQPHTPSDDVWAHESESHPEAFMPSSFSSNPYESTTTTIMDAADPITPPPAYDKVVNFPSAPRADYMPIPSAPSRANERQE